MLYLQALFYYTIKHYDKRYRNFTTILNLIRTGKPDENGKSLLDELFEKWEKEEPDALRSKAV